MDDSKIIELFFLRNEDAIRHTHDAYTYMAAWKAMPPKRPTALALFLGKITRNLSINRWRTRNTNKRGGGQLVLALDELAECADKRQNVEDQYAYQEILNTVNAFLGSLPETERNLFLRRY